MQALGCRAVAPFSNSPQHERTDGDDTAPLVVIINMATKPNAVMITVTEINHDKCYYVRYQADFL